MEAGQWVTVAVTVALFIVGYLLKRIDDRNTRQHAEAQSSRATAARQTNVTLTRIERKVDSHIQWHAENPPIYPKEVA